MSNLVDKYDCFNALTVGVVHTGIDYLGVAGRAQPFNSRAGAKGAMSAVSDLAGTALSNWMGARKDQTPAPDQASKQMWIQLAASGAAYPLIDMVADIDNRPFVMQFLVQAGSSFVGGKIYEPIQAWAMKPAS